MNGKRYDLIDTLRGLSVISMIGFHACWILNHFGLFISEETLFGPAFTVWQRSICIGFIIISGFSFPFGRRHLRSGIKVFLAGLLITAGTCIFLPDMPIIFGILTFIGSEILLMIPVDKLVASRFEKSSGAGIVTAVFCMAAFLITYNINLGFIGWPGVISVMLPEGLYKGYFATYLGFMEPGFFSVDYFSILPWSFLYMFGYSLNKLITGRCGAERLLSWGIPGVRVVGKHSFPIYIIHPVVLYVIVYILAVKMR